MTILCSQFRGLLALAVVGIQAATFTFAAQQEFSPVFCRAHTGSAGCKSLGLVWAEKTLYGGIILTEHNAVRDTGN